MRFLVTGGCGFIGSHLVDSLLGDGHEVAVLDDLSTGKRENLAAGARLILGDVSDLATVVKAMEGMDGCFHLAAIASVQRSTEDWAATHRINQTGSINVFEAARMAGAGRALPVVFASSAAVYGDCAVMPITEDLPTLPISPYGADKLGSELHGRAAAAVFASRVIGLRFFNVFGPRQDPKSPYSGVISIFMDRALGGRDLTVQGDGEQTRDFVFVADVVRALRLSMARLAALECGYFGAFNVCRGESISINQLAMAVRDACRSTVAITHGPARSGDIRASLGNPSLAFREIGFQAQTQPADGLARTADWCSSCP
jgi:UDP-glucose 4-epimerase